MHAVFLLVVLTACGRIGFSEQRDAGADARVACQVAGTPCGGGLVCASDGTCSVATVTVGCGLGNTTTGDQLCQGLGFAGAVTANGYYWFQCAGFVEHDCPDGWDAQTLQCSSWCGNADCTGWEYCGTSETIQELLGDGSTVFDPEAYGRQCGPFNPGWLVRVQCRS
jgi:hypothetical protein